MTVSPILPKVSRLRQKLSEKAKREPEFRFYVLYDRAFRFYVLYDRAFRFDVLQSARYLVRYADDAVMIFEYIEVFYNRVRRHSTLGYLSPTEYESRSIVERLTQGQRLSKVNIVRSEDSVLVQPDIEF